MIYLDFAATTKPSAESLQIFNEVNESFWANPNSMHDFGIKSQAVLDYSRKTILENLNAAKDYNLIFTSSATESNNLAINSMINSKKGRIISSNIEHPSVREPLLNLQKSLPDGQLLPSEQFVFLDVDENGQVPLDILERSVNKNTALVSIMHVNNEVGSINDVFEMARIIKQKNKSTIFHCDFVQSIGKLPISLDNSQIDFISISGHKIEGIKGVGALIYKKNLKLTPLFFGGTQEFGFRPSTTNPASAASLAKSVKLAVKSQKENFEKVCNLQNILIDALLQVPEIQINTPKNKKNEKILASPFIVNFSIDKKSETVVNALSKKNIYISTVSACSSKKSQESYVIKAMFNQTQRAASSLRVSISANTTENEILTFVDELKNILDNL